MTELSNEPTFQEDDPGTERKTAPGVMLISILLLIGGFLLASAMLIHYGTEGRDKTGNPRPGFSQNLEKVKSMVAGAETNPENPAPAQPLETASKPKEADSKKSFFSKQSGKVRWPRLKLAGFGLPAEGEDGFGFAIINGKHVTVGNTVSGVKLAEILEHGVRVEYKGESKTLSMELVH